MSFTRHLPLVIRDSPLLPAEVFDDVILCLVKLDAVQLMFFVGEIGFQLLPNGDDNIFARGHLSFQERNVEIEIAMVHLREHVLLNDVTHELEIDAIAGVCLRGSFHRDKQVIIVPVPVWIRAFPERF